MIKWIVRKYLNKKLEDLNYQILSLEQELCYAGDLLDDETGLLKAHKKAIDDRDNLRYVVEIII